MRGFSDKALILFPEIDMYADKGVKYKQQFRLAYATLVRYLSDCHIQADSFYTDDVAREVALPETVFVTPLSMSERFFTKTKCDGMGLSMDIKYDFPELVSEAEKETPTDLSANDSAKLSVILKHIQYVTERAIKQYAIVVQFKATKHNQYKVDMGKDKPQIRLIVDVRTFSMKAFMGGQEEDPCSILGVPYANMSLLNWGLI